MKKFIIGILLALLSIVLIGCGQKETSANGYKTVNLGYPSGGSDFLGGVAGVAQDKRYFEEELNKIGYTIKFFPFAGAGPAVNDAFVSGDIDFVMYADFPGIVLKSKGVDLDLLGILSESANAQIIVKNDSDIKSLKDLKGKKIGFPKGTYVQKYLLEALDFAGISKDDVELINMTSEAQSGLLTGSVDALAYVDSTTQKLIHSGQGVRAISSTQDNENWGGSSIFAGSHSYIEKNPEVPKAMFKALLRAKDEVIANPKEYYSHMSKRSQIPEDAAREMHDLDGGKFDYISLDINEKTLNRIDSAKKFLLDTKLISKDFDINSWVDNSHYKKALSEYKK